MSRQKGSKNKVTRFIEDVFTPKEAKPDNNYLLCVNTDFDALIEMINLAINKGYHCVGGICIHDIRNQVTNEYEPHYYQAMERVGL